MNSSDGAESDLIERVRGGDAAAWQSLIDRYEGRLLAFASSRVRDRASAEDIVQETFIGFLTSLPNFDPQRNLQAYLFSICGYKLTDHLRRNGRRPALQWRASASSSPGMPEPAASVGGASTVYRSHERRQLESDAVAQAIAELVDRWRSENQWQKLSAIEMIFLAGMSNKAIAEHTGIPAQTIANYKSDFQIRLRSIIGRMGLDEAVFPELAQP